jgi:uncharacterized protein (DUF58 family)
LVIGHSFPVIVPQTRLLVWFAAVALPFAVVGAVHAEALPVAVGAIGALALLAVLDLVLGAGSPDRFSVKLPELVRFSKDRPGVIEVRIGNGGQRARRLRIGLVLPEEIQPRSEDQWVVVPPDVEWSRFEWSCTPTRRGKYQVTQARLETASPLGFWALRKSVPVAAELRVYPNLFTERKNLAALFLNRGFFGVHSQRQVGKGREFEKLREYIPGDSFDDIHWKATAKRGRPVTKVFQIERTQEVYVIVDASRLAAREPAGISEGRGARGEVGPEFPPIESRNLSVHTTILERYVTAALVLGLAAEQQGDLFGLLTFSDKVENFVRARNGRAHYNACRDAIYTLEPRRVTPDFDEMASFIRLRLRRRALLVFLTALDDPVLAESFVRSMDLLSRQHLVLINSMKPPGADPLFSLADVGEVDDLYQRLGGHLQWHTLRELEKTLQRRGVQFALVENEKLCPQLVSQYLGVKRRQLI